MNRELLEKPFAPEQIKQRVGSFGNVIDYVEGHAIIKRLNDSFDGLWSFEIMKHEVMDDLDEVIVLGRLSAGEVVKMQFGSSRITRAKETGNVISLADDLKAAATDAMKKCATLLGVGLHLYNGDRALNEKNGQGRTNNFRNGTEHQDQPQDDQGNGGGGRITNRQLNYLVNLGRSLGWTSKDLDEEALELYGSKMAYLNVKDASGFIEALKNRMT